jgi:hypothetical protein
MYVVGTTRAGDPDRPNEDWFGTVPGLVVVLDGATIRTETGCVHGVAWYSKNLGVELVKECANTTTPLPTALSNAIRTVAAMHHDCDLSHPGTPSAAAAIVRWSDRNTLEYLVLGDVAIVADINQKVSIIGDDRVSQTAQPERRAAHGYPIGSPEKRAALISMKNAELAARNKPGGYWIAAADPMAASEAITGEILLNRLERLAILTDGARRTTELFGNQTWRAVLNTLQRGGPDELIDRVRRAEHRDILGTAFPRNKVSDDATAVFLMLGDDTRSRRNAVPAPTVDRRREIALRGKSLLMGGEPRNPSWEAWSWSDYVTVESDER